MNNLLATYTGKVVDITLLHEHPELIDINDITHSLSGQNRFGGHGSAFYSVAQHSVRVASLLPPELQLCGLLHDATEAYLVDLPSPVKAVLPGYRQLENKLWSAVVEAFSMDPAFSRMPDQVKLADYAVLVAEAAELFPLGNLSDLKKIQLVAPSQEPMSQQEAKDYFTETFIRIKQGKYL